MYLQITYKFDLYFIIEISHRVMFFRDDKITRRDYLRLNGAYHFAFYNKFMLIVCNHNTYTLVRHALRHYNLRFGRVPKVRVDIIFS